MSKSMNLGRAFASVIVASQWLQAPLYFGLIVAQGVYVWQFCVELYHLVCGLGGFKAQEIMLMVLGLIDVVMISNLLKSFIEIEKLQKTDVYVQMGIHFLFIISAMGLAYVAKITETAVAESRPAHKPAE